MLLAFIPVAIFFGEQEELKQSRELAARQPNEAELGASGTYLFVGVRTWTYWAITISTFLALTVINGTLMHLVPLLTDRGISVGAATAALSFSEWRRS